MNQKSAPVGLNDTQSTTHPEQKSGEVWLKDCSKYEPDEFDEIDYQTKRAGDIAYDEVGRVKPYHFPVFVWVVEYNTRHKETKIGQ